MSELPPSEREVLALVAEGLSNPQIAERRGVALPTVETQVSRLLLRLGVDNRLRAARWYWEHAGEAASA